MSRAHITALALVNWKGVFYERYRLDRHVTALEGANGAGKTTVMIAAYLVLLPDMSRLRFTNVGESGATGGDRGIWGRLGEPGRPSYAALDIALADGKRIVAGVRLRRLSEPTVEPTAFIIDQLPADVALADLLLVRSEDSDQVAELAEVKQAVQRAGGTIDVFRSIKEYFAALFDRGVTPLRLSTDEERNKQNEMLRTSMTGGISRVLTSELRHFLLKEETGLGDVLGRMRANLDACRRTRSEVAESRIVERDITGVYEAGQAMFTSALHASRLAAEEAARRTALARAALDAAVRGSTELEAEVSERSAREAELDQRVAAARLELEQQNAALERMRAAALLSQKHDVLADELHALEQRAEATRVTQSAAVSQRTLRRAEREQLQDAYQRAALGLAHLQDGLDELHRRAHAHRQLGQRLDDARAALGDPIALDDVPEQLARLNAQRGPLIAERSQRQRERDGASSMREEYQRALSALTVLEARAKLADLDTTADPLSRARLALLRLHELDADVTRLAQLEREHHDLEHLVARQRVLHVESAALGLTSGPGSALELQSRLAQQTQTLRLAEESIRDDSARIDAISGTRTRGQEQRAQLEERAIRWRSLCAAVQRVSSALGADTLTSAADLGNARERVAEDAATATAERSQCIADREAWLRLAAELEGPGAALDPELVRLRDELGAELLVSRFDDVLEDEAATLEARLGPLNQALVVTDPAESAAALLDKPRTLQTVWLVRAGVDLDSGVATSGTDDVVIHETFGTRITRRPTQPSVGAGARAARARALRQSAEQADTAIERLALRLRQLTGLRRDLDLLASQEALWTSGDPAPQLQALELEEAPLAAAEATAREALATARARASTLRGEVERLHRLSAESALLESPERDGESAELGARITVTRAARAELAAVANDRKSLGELLEVLRRAPSDDTTAEQMAAKIAALDAALERNYQTAAALEDVLTHRHAESWGNAAEALATQASLVPTLTAQHSAAREALNAADQAVIASDAAWESATGLAHDAEAQRGAVAEQKKRLAEELRTLGGAPAPQLMASATEALSIVSQRANELEQDARIGLGELARVRERAEQSLRQVAAAEAAAALEAQRAMPATHAWQALKASVETAGLVASAADGGGANHTSGELNAQAASRRALLVERLERSRGGEELAVQIREANVVDAWQLARDWLRRRIPAQIAQADDALSGLELLRDHLDLLEGRLARQEVDLRGASEDVARGIDVQVRRARGQIRRLNLHLNGVHFGSIAAIRVDMRRIERMEQILRALRDGEAQELLFLPSMPIEDALEEIFKRYGGGGRSGGQKLLDYREYLELVVEIKRQTSEAWEPASSSRLSTGEAIGVGAALMMVVLTEWERDSNLLRARAYPGSLRFLFLDEANRLSRDNLGVLFELCRNLDLQLMIAAPEVARAEGNTTYRLIRHVTADGREEVIVSGRRAVISPDDAAMITEPAIDAPLSAETTAPDSSG